MAERDEITFGGELDRIANADPFTLFVVVMASGSRFEIDGQSIVVSGRNVVTLVTGDGGYHVLRHNQMTELSVPGDLS